MKIINIIKGWKRLIFSPPREYQQVFEERLAVCHGCEFLCAGVCTACGCVVAAKTKVLEEFCPENKWQGSPYTNGRQVFLVLEEAPPVLQRKWMEYISDPQTLAKLKTHPQLPEGAIMWSDWEEFLSRL